MSKNLKVILVAGASLLMMVSVASTSNLAHASHQSHIRIHRQARIHKSKHPFKQARRHHSKYLWFVPNWEFDGHYVDIGKPIRIKANQLCKDPNYKNTGWLNMKRGDYGHLTWANLAPSRAGTIAKANKFARKNGKRAARFVSRARYNYINEKLAK